MGTKYTAEPYDGPSIGNTYMRFRGVQIVATDTETGKRRAIWETDRGRTPCKKLGHWAYHYKSGFSRADAEKFRKTMVEAVKLAEKLNTEGE